MIHGTLAKAMLFERAAAQVVYDVENLPSEVLSYFRRLPYRPQLSAVRQEPKAPKGGGGWSHIQMYILVYMEYVYFCM